MAKPAELSLGQWNEMLNSYQSESDRGAAILAGSFTEHALGQYLRWKIKDKKVADELFNAMGPLASFSQRIAIAYAFELVSKSMYLDLDTIRKIRNYFAHHPFETSFITNEVKQLCQKLSMFQEIAHEHYENNPGLKYRTIYLLSCGMTCGSLLNSLETEKKMQHK